MVTDLEQKVFDNIVRSNDVCLLEVVQTEGGQGEMSLLSYWMFFTGIERRKCLSEWIDLIWLKKCFFFNQIT